VAQKFTNTTLPCNCFSDSGLPLSVATVTSGAGVFCERIIQPENDAMAATTTAMTKLRLLFTETIPKETLVCPILGFLLAFVTFSMAGQASALSLDDLTKKDSVSQIKDALSQNKQSSSPSSLNALSNQDMVGGLKQALSQGAESAVKSLGSSGGYLNNAKVKIPLPPSMGKVGKTMRSLGMGKYADELDVAMNRAAEAAVPEAKTLLTDSVKKMSVEDAKGILQGGDDSATQYFRRTTSEQLTQKFKPIVQAAMSRVNVADKYNRFAGKASKLGLVKEQDANLDNYVTQKALDGLYLMVAEEEKAIRKDPASAVGGLARKVFGALK
jgi:hypothetical protein